jgi:hypothetical protein
VISKRRAVQDLLTVIKVVVLEQPAVAGVREEGKAGGLSA